MNINAAPEAGAALRPRGRRKKQRDIIYLPTKQSHDRTTFIIGYACRALLAALFVFGLCFFVADAFCLVPDRAGADTIFFSALFFSAALSLLCCGGGISAVGAAALVGGIFARLAVVSVDLIEVVRQAVVSQHNAIIDRIIFAGLTTVHTLYLAPGGETIYPEEEIAKVGLFLLTLLIAFLIVPVIVKRVSALYVALVTAVFVVPASLYNIIRENWGFSFLVTAIAGVFVLWTYDRSYTKNSRKKRFVTADEPVGILEDEADGKPRRKKKDKKAKKERVGGKDKVDDSIYILESNADKRKRIRAERAAEKRILKVEKREYKLRAKEKRRSEKLDRKTVYENAALGGITGIAAAAMAFLIIVLPANFVKESNGGIPYLSDIVSGVRKYVNAYFWSQEVDLNHVSSSGLDNFSGNMSGPRPTETVYPEYQDVVIATVEVPYNAPVYLRSWLGTRYENDHWYSATLSEIDDYKEKFGETFTPEKITENYYQAMYPTYANYAKSSAYGDNTMLGFLIERVSVTRKNGGTTLLYLPSFVRPSTGILAYNSDSKTILPYSLYYDGIWTSNFFFEGTSYTTESLVTTMRYPEIGSVYARGTSEYLKTTELIASGEPDNMVGQDDAMILAYVGEYASELGIEDIQSSLLYRYITSMTDEQRTEVREGAKLEREYAEYVRSTYLGMDRRDEGLIYNLAKQALADAGLTLTPGSIGEESYHETALAIIDYLRNNYNYSITDPEAEGTDETATGTEPGTEAETEPETEADTSDELEESGKTAINTFLTETHTGYCVQFASSLVLMLRSLGIPARYCEGYIATDFSSGFGTDREAALYYSTDILDSNAHAWVEVYYDGLGWVQYEATPSYHDAMYGNGLSEPPINSVDPRPPVQEQEPQQPVVDPTEEQPSELPQEDPIDVARLAAIILAIAAAVLLVIGLTVYFILFAKRSRRAVKARNELIERCRDKASVNAMTEEELRDVAHRLDLGIFDVYHALGLSPETGELSDEYAERLDSCIGGASDTGTKTVLDLVSREEFGHSLTRDMLGTLAGYYYDLTKNVYEGLSLKDKFVLRGVFHVV